jgi:hypothetical protein
MMKKRERTSRPKVPEVFGDVAGVSRKLVEEAEEALASLKKLQELNKKFPHNRSYRTKMTRPKKALELFMTQCEERLCKCSEGHQDFRLRCQDLMIQKKSRRKRCTQCDRPRTLKWGVRYLLKDAYKCLWTEDGKRRV